MAAPVRKSLCRIFERYKRFSYLLPNRCYTTEPPEWMGGISILNRPGHYDFPKHCETFESRMARLRAAENIVERVNSGVEYTPVKKNRNEAIAISITNRRDKALEKQARLQKLEIPLDLVKEEWLNESRVTQTKLIADHYGIYRDLFDGDYFMPVFNISIQFNYDDEYVTPVYIGNRILPAECKTAPTIQYESSPELLWTLLLTNPDGHLTENNAEYVHWLVGNIPGDAVQSGETLVDYLQPIPARGTGFHRHVFFLFKQKHRIDYTKWKQQLPCKSLTNRTFRTSRFFNEHRDSLTPLSLAFFQSQWDESVRDVFHNVLDMAEPTYEYIHPPAYHPPPVTYPHKEPFDRYFDRYRDKKDLAEEVLRIRLHQMSPFTGHPPHDKYALVHHRPKKYIPSWLRMRQELMHRRIEQFKHL